jgi:preprotein translocase subunit SecB
VRPLCYPAGRIGRSGARLLFSSIFKVSEMAEEEGATGATGADEQMTNGGDILPQAGVISQYVKDLSFENPNAPASIMTGGGNPGFNVSINVGVKKQSEEVYAVELTLNAKAERDKNVLFNVELVYGGVFRIKNVPEAQLAPLMMIECPRLIFPFARQILANITQQGGFPPLMMEPVDF